jgi:hypothetical protein
LVFIEAVRPGEAHTAQFVCNLRYPLPALTRERETREAGQRRYKIGERVICRDSVRAVGEFAIERDNSVPTTVKGQVAAKAEDTIPD